MSTTDNVSFLAKVKYYFTELEFYQTKKTLGVGELHDKKILWTLLVYLLASLGIFSRQITNFPKVSINFANLQWNVLITSFIFGLVALPFFIKRVNAVNSDPGFTQILSAFGIGFFMDFADNAIINYYFK
jgi:hypothetical protein